MKLSISMQVLLAVLGAAALAFVAAGLVLA